MLQIHEIYKSIQGESTYAGLPCIFVRLTGCNLRCKWCDTPQAFFGGKRMSVAQVLTHTAEMNCKLIEITGGEPLLQDEVYPLMQKLLERGDRVLLETSGSISLEHVPSDVIKIMDLKCPASGESEKNLFKNLKLLSPADEIKFVIADRADYDWCKEQIERFSIPQNQILFSSVCDRLELKDLAKWILGDGLNVRLQAQLHKFIWDKNAVGC
jgi:7-carboxy-7-deazaguanine synthase